MLRVDVISIGTLSRNLLWGEQEKVRTPHATTTLIRTGKRNILVDPGLPSQVLGARLHERTGLRQEQIDTVFLSNFRPAHRMGLSLFTKARILISEAERETMLAQLEQMRDAIGNQSEEARAVEEEIAILEKTEVCEDKLAPGVDLFPLPGFTPGTSGLLLSLPTMTVLVAGDGVPTQEHLLAMQVLKESADVKAAAESLREVYELADLIIPGHDNIFINPRSHGM